MGSRAERVLPIAEAPVDGGLGERRMGVDELAEALDVAVGDGDGFLDEVRRLRGKAFADSGRKLGGGRGQGGGE